MEFQEDSKAGTSPAPESIATTSTKEQPSVQNTVPSPLVKPRDKKNDDILGKAKQP